MDSKDAEMGREGDHFAIQVCFSVPISTNVFFFSKTTNSGDSYDFV